MADDLRTVTLSALVDMYNRGEVNADDYYAEMERRAKRVIEAEIQAVRAARHA